MFPLRDRLPTRSFPFFNYLILTVNVFVFVFQGAAEEAGYSQMVTDWGFTPRLFLQHPVYESSTILTSMFMHGGWLHLLTNMLFLWIFGDNVEDTIGHFRYLLFYLGGGVCAAVAQMVVDPFSPLPMVGASGAIAGVLAGYLSLYPRSPITVINPALFTPFFWLWFAFGLLIELPAWVVALEFFVVNLLSGFSSLTFGQKGAGGVAFFAHVGGFVAGLVLIRLMMSGRTRLVADPWRGWRPPRRT